MEVVKEPILFFVKDIFNQCCLISWRSTRLKRVVRSTLTAETLAFADEIDAGKFVQGLAEEFQIVE